MDENTTAAAIAAELETMGAEAIGAAPEGGVKPPTPTPPPAAGVKPPETPPEGTKPPDPAPSAKTEPAAKPRDEVSEELSILKAERALHAQRQETQQLRQKTQQLEQALAE